MTSPDDTCDFVVIGGGPAGSTTASLLADAGHSVLVLEAAKFPRFAVGEIVAPTALWRVWHRLGLTVEVLDEHFIRKWNGAWFAPDGTKFSFEQDVHPDDHTCQAFVYSVERSRYDDLLLRLAERKGAAVLEEARVEGFLREDGGRIHGVRYRHADQTREVRCKLVVDASGRGNVIGRALNLRMETVELKSFSVFAHYEGARRDEGKAAGDVALYFREDMWFWWAPLKGTKSSIGVVANRDRHYEEYARDPEAFYDKYVRSCAEIQERLGQAKRVTGFRTPPSGQQGAMYKDYHYRTARMIGDGWVLVGDAGGFVDPVFSAGLFVAQTSAMWLADELIAAAAEGDLSMERLAPYEQRYNTDIKQVMEHIQSYAIDYFDPEFVNFYLRLGSRSPRIRDLYIRTFVAYDKNAIAEYTRLIERHFKSRSPPSTSSPGA